MTVIKMPEFEKMLREAESDEKQKASGREEKKMSEKNEKKNETENNEARSMEVVFILDRSGSMTGREDDTIGGFNATLKEQKKKPGEVFWSTVLFDDEYEVIHDRVPIARVKELTDREYYTRGCTALLDAIGRSIHRIAEVHKHIGKENVPDKTLFVITTDGMENSSTEYTYRKVRQMIEKEQGKYGWEFLFLGANMDAVSVAGRMGIRPERSATFLNDEEGIRGNYSAIGGAITSLRENGMFDESALDEVRKDFKKRSK